MNFGDSGPMAERGCFVEKVRDEIKREGDDLHLERELNELRDIWGGIAE